MRVEVGFRPVGESELIDKGTIERRGTLELPEQGSDLIIVRSFKYHFNDTRYDPDQDGIVSRVPRAALKDQNQPISDELLREHEIAKLNAGTHEVEAMIAGEAGTLVMNCTVKPLSLD